MPRLASKPSGRVSGSSSILPLSAGVTKVSLLWNRETLLIFGLVLETVRPDSDLRAGVYLQGNHTQLQDETSETFGGEVRFHKIYPL